jgi:hypothetical protein
VTNLSELTIVIKGAGEMASAVAWRLYMANFKKILMLEAGWKQPNPWLSGVRFHSVRPCTTEAKSWRVLKR